MSFLEEARCTFHYKSLPLCQPIAIDDSSFLQQDFAYALNTFMVEYMASETEAVTSNATTMRALTYTQTGRYMDAWCFDLVSSSRICSLRSNKLARMAKTILRLLPTISKERDIVIMNVGAW